MTHSRHKNSTETSSQNRQSPLNAEVEQTILRALRGLRYGQITIAVQDGQVTQIDRSEHTRQFRNKLTSK